MLRLFGLLTITRSEHAPGPSADLVAWRPDNSARPCSRRCGLQASVGDYRCRRLKLRGDADGLIGSERRHGKIGRGTGEIVRVNQPREHVRIQIPGVPFFASRDLHDVGQRCKRCIELQLWKKLELMKEHVQRLCAIVMLEQRPTTGRAPYHRAVFVSRHEGGTTEQGRGLQTIPVVGSALL